MIEVDEQAVVEFTQALVRIRTVNDEAPGGREQRAALLVADKMREFGWDPLITEVAPGRPNVVAVVEGGAGDGPTLMFEGHTDVVTEGDRDAWTFDPYAGDIVEGMLRGRGSADMKAGVAAMIYATKALVDAGPFPGRIVLAALVDEEGLMLGAKAFAATPLAGAIDGAVCCEPEAGEICVAAKGALRLRLRLRGVMAHGAMPQHARNPLGVAARIVLALEDIQEHYHVTHGRHRYLGEVYLTPTVLLGGDVDQINCIPALAEVCVGVRTVIGVDHAEVVQRITRSAERIGATAGVAVEVDVVDDRPAVEIAETDPLVAALVAGHEAVHGVGTARFGGVPGATDGTILTRDAGMATVVYGPGDKWIAHQADEVVPVADIVACTHVYAHMAQTFLKAT